MLTFGAPALLAAGVLAALVPLALHLLRPLPGDRRPLPTARFLTREPRNRLRIAAPDHLPLLALRMSLMALIGAALAQPGWLPRRHGRADIVLVDAAVARDSAAWMRALAGAGRRIGPDDAVAVFDSANGRARLESALAALPAAARGRATQDSLRVTLVSPLRAADWSEAAGALRVAAWPGRITLVEVAGDSANPAPAAQVTAAAPGSGRYLPAALAAIQAPMVSVDSADVLFTATAGGARTGASVVIAPAAVGGRTDRLRFDDGEPVSALRGQAPPPGQLLAAWADGAPAATMVRDGDGCRVHAGFPLEAGELPLSVRYPHLIRMLLHACRPAAAPPGALDPGAKRVLAGTGPEWVSARTLGTATPVPLGRWILLLALLAAIAETLLARHRERRA